MRKLKPAKNDYTKSMLPQTRKAVFFDVLKLQWKSLGLLGLILCVFFAPIVLVTILADVMQADIFLSLENADAEALQNGQNSILFLQTLHGLVLIPLLALFSVGLSGALRVIRQYAWGENVHLSTDFLKGIRDNGWQTAALAALGGVIYVLCLMVTHTASAYGGGMISVLSMLPVGISLLVVFPILGICLAMIPVYTNPLRATIKNAFFVYCRSLLKVLGAVICCILPWVAAVLPHFYCHIFGGLVGALLTPFAGLGWTLFCYHQFDVHINPLVCPQLIGKGITWDTD